MQTFLPYADFILSAKALDNRRLGKQRVEALQILQTLKQGPTTKRKDCDRLKKTPWYNHPAVQMWKGYEDILCSYTSFIVDEWTNRGFKDTVGLKILTILESLPIKETNPPFLGNESFHLSHRSNLVRKDPAHYLPIFGPTPNNLPYVWPSKQALI